MGDTGGADEVLFVGAQGDGVRVGAVGVSGLPGEVDEQLALAAIEQTA